MAVPKLRFKEFCGDWSKSKISDATEYLVDGTHFSPKSTEGEFKYITSKNIRNEGLDLNNISYISKDEHESIFKRCKVQFGDILLTKDGANTGNCCLNTLNEEFSLLSSVAVLRGKKETFDNRFMLQIFQSDLGQNTILSSMAGQAISRITLAKLKNYSFNFPKFDEQTKIASFLSAVDEKISQLTQKHELLSQYKQGMMQKLFSQEIRFKADDGSEFREWEENQLLDLSTKKSSKVTAKDIEDNDGDYIVFGASGHFRNINSYTESEPYIAIVKDGAGAGRLFLMPEKSSVLGTLEIVKPNLNIQLNFLFYRMQLIDFSSYIKGSTIPHVYFKDYSQEKIYLPCLEEQNKIANFLSAIDQKIEVVAQQIEQAKTWKKGLLQQMFV